ncbi:hypothetical protein ACGK9U_10715 [Mariniflexile sp. HNIBRBA6329]|uniref:hypothetical protein n=1 Tax=Mariniflexile sp. HNIBRBA6329 TaxID=3373088 RepID=UPI003746BDFF
MRRIIFCFLCVTVFLFNGCAYEFSEDYYNDIKVTDPTATLALNDFNNNITLTSPVNVGYQYDGDNKHRLFNIIIYINNVQIHSDSQESGMFFIDVHNLSEGAHQLKVEYYFSSGTGSLAEAYNQEGYVATQDYTFHVDKSIGNAPNLTSVKIIDGTLYVYWDALTHSKFKDAHLIIKNEKNQHLKQIQLSKEQLLLGVYNDDFSLNNSLHYSIMLTNDYTSTTSNEVFINIPELVFSIEIINQNQHVMRWGEHPLYGNFDYYKYSNYGYNNEILSSRGGELLFNTVPVFGEKTYHYLYLYKNNQNTGTINKIMDFGKPFDLNLPEEIVFSKLANAYFAVEKVGANYYGAIQQVYLHKLNPNDLTIMQSVLISEIVANSYLDLTLDPVSNNLIIDSTTASYLINSSNLSIINSWKISDFAPVTGNIRLHYRNGYIFIGSTIYNAETKAIIYSATVNYYFNVSDDGKYFYNQDAIYEISNNTVNFITSTDTGNFIHTIEFLPDQNKCIYSKQTSNPVIYDFSTNTKTTINQLSGVNELHYDQSSGKVLFSQLHNNSYGGHKSIVNVYDMNTQNFERLQVYDSHYGHYYRFLNNKLIFSGGLYLDTYFSN